jgi:hypothetical protein
MGEKNGKTDATGFLALRIECRDGKFARVYGVMFGGCHPSSYGKAETVDAGGLKFEDGKLTGTVKMATTPPIQLELDVKAEGAAMRGAFAGKQGEQEVKGFFNGEFDYPETDTPVVAYFMLKPGWDGGATTTPPVLATLTYKDAATGTLAMVPYNGKAKLDVQVEKMGVTLYPAIKGAFTVKVASDAYTPGVYTMTVTANESMGLSGAVGTACVGSAGARGNCVVTKDGQPVSTVLAEFVIRNARKLMPAS